MIIHNFGDIKSELNTLIPHQVFHDAIFGRVVPAKIFNEVQLAQEIIQFIDQGSLDASD